MYFTALYREIKTKLEKIIESATTPQYKIKRNNKNPHRTLLFQFEIIFTASKTFVVNPIK